MIQLPMVIQPYAPQLHLGDWQIVVFANRRRNRLSVERWHSSEKPYHVMEGTGQVLRIDTGIRAFRRQMPVLASALDEIDTNGMVDADIVEAVFRVLARVYQGVPAGEHGSAGEEHLSDQEFSDFLEERKQIALAGISQPVTH